MLWPTAGIVASSVWMSTTWLGVSCEQVARQAEYSEARCSYTDVDHPKAAGYAPLSEDFAAPPLSEGPRTTTQSSKPMTSSLYSSTTTGTKVGMVVS